MEKECLENFFELYIIVTSPEFLLFWIEYLKFKKLRTHFENILSPLNFLLCSLDVLI